MKENLKIETQNKRDNAEATKLFRELGYPHLFADEMFVYATSSIANTIRTISFDELRELAREKEYLNDKFELVVTNQPEDGWLLVPDGANRYTRAINGHETFWDNDNSILIHGGYGDMSGRYTFGYYVEHYKAKILWQRENKVETAKGREGNAGRFLHQWAYEAFGRGEDLEYSYPLNGMWVELSDSKHSMSIFNGKEVTFRLKPQTIQIGSRTINKPISVKPERNTKYYFPSLHSFHKYDNYSWQDTDADNRIFNANLCHLTSVDAINHCDALLELMK